MRDRDLYAQILGIVHPRKVTDVQLDLPGQEVTVFVDWDTHAPLCCPACKAGAPGYDFRSRRWRHLDTCQYKTFLEAKVPRVNCAEHGVQQISVPWAEPNSRFTGLMEAIAIDWLKEASISAVSRQLRLTWDELDGIRTRAVERGLARRQLEAPQRMGVDETSFQKRHEYVTIVIDLDGPTVLHVADDRKAESLTSFYDQLTPEQIEAIAVVAMDMHGPYIKATRESLPDAERKIAFDKFHVAKQLGDAVDKVRRAEHRALIAKDISTLKGTNHLWLQHPDSMDEAMWDSTFQILRNANLQTSRA